VGTTAEVHVPSAAASDVTAVPAPFAGEASYEDGYTIYTVPAGLWHFTSRSA
jgi:alpha-L-rhamnosidase